MSPCASRRAEGEGRGQEGTALELLTIVSDFRERWLRLIEETSSLMARAIKRVPAWPRRAVYRDAYRCRESRTGPAISRDRELGNLSPEGHKGSGTRSRTKETPRRCLLSMLTGQLQRLPTCALAHARVLEMSARAGGKILQRGY